MLKYMFFHEIHKSTTNTRWELWWALRWALRWALSGHCMGTVWLNTSSPAWWKGAENCFTAASDVILSPDPCPAHQHKQSKKQAGTVFLRTGSGFIQEDAESL